MGDTTVGGGHDCSVRGVFERTRSLVRVGASEGDLSFLIRAVEGGGSRQYKMTLATVLGVY